ncbi:MAG: fructose-6-phosphate aldolase [Candidatus Koribacter versatilis]|uniref:Probable transaldolase n=1 Tax=Candidatus Korobacter versatilis TaxID=658062 RepID=A0A932A7L4_9BACT|nr:fructose-6-phosphate aldolase [Candidatus Koribacter versatilis]
MKFFIDTANLQEIREAAAMGILDGVTTNPSLMAKEGKPNNKETIREICGVVGGPVSVEVVAIEPDAMIKEGEEYAGWDKHVVVKLPTTKAGVKACKALADKGIKVNMTLCFSPNQALLVAKAGATYVSPFIGRLDDISENGMDVIRNILTIYRNYNYQTQVLAASIRHPMHVVDAALAGAHVSTIPFKVLEMMFNHPLTDKGLAAFLKDYEKVRKG